ncbi:MAG: lasso RiPP family leader peptide-containing protein [Nitrospirae bacterium]|nr:lasso RiPP family leader peptide-containing protein [Nitrospirota bacterium]
MTDKKDEKEAKNEPRKPYTAPALVVYGTVEKLTQNIGTTGTDGLTGSTLP